MNPTQKLFSLNRATCKTKSLSGDQPGLQARFWENTVMHILLCGLVSLGLLADATCIRAQPNPASTNVDVEMNGVEELVS